MLIKKKLSKWRDFVFMDWKTQLLLFLVVKKSVFFPNSYIGLIQHYQNTSTFFGGNNKPLPINVQ